MGLCSRLMNKIPDEKLRVSTKLLAAGHTVLVADCLLGMVLFFIDAVTSALEDDDLNQKTVTVTLMTIDYLLVVTVLCFEMYHSYVLFTHATRKDVDRVQAAKECGRWLESCIMALISFSGVLLITSYKKSLFLVLASGGARVGHILLVFVYKKRLSIRNEAVQQNVGLNELNVDHRNVAVQHNARIIELNHGPFPMGRVHARNAPRPHG